MTKKERAALLANALEEVYPDARCSLDYSTPLEMLLATQLSAQCTDARVNVVTRMLFARYKTAADYAGADYDELSEIIRPLGFFRSKAKNIIDCCQRICVFYGGEVPDTMEELLTLAGVGRKTANLVLGEIFHQPAVVVDTHCIRLTNRLGLVAEDDPVKIEFTIKKLLPPSQTLDFCHRLVMHGRARCMARRPDCEMCEIAGLCKKVGVVSK